MRELLTSKSSIKRNLFKKAAKAVQMGIKVNIYFPFVFASNFIH